MFVHEKITQLDIEIQNLSRAVERLEQLKAQRDFYMTYADCVRAIGGADDTLSTEDNLETIGDVFAQNGLTFKAQDMR
jgi:hypothetical protein